MDTCVKKFILGPPPHSSGDIAVASHYLMYALYYTRNWGTAIAFMSANTGVPLHAWRTYASTGMSPKEAETLYLKHASSKRAVRLAILTGPYMANLEKPMIIIDIDNPPVDSKEEKKQLMKKLAREGYIIVNTPRGFHIHAFINRKTSNRLPYIISVTRSEEDKEKTIGEGGVLHPHPWTSPPSVRNLGENRWFTYSFVLPDGRTFASYDVNLLRQLQSPIVSLDDLIDDLELYLMAKIGEYRPLASGPVPKDSERETSRKKPVFYDLEEFIAHVGEVTLPRCVAWVLYHYINEGIGDEYRATRLLSMYLDNEELMSKVPRGRRFLVAAATALFLAHVIEFVKFDEILEVLSYGIESWPYDDGQNLDYKLKYLFYADEEGYVYPRYSGLGALSPLQVLGEGFYTNCPFSRKCKGRSPWRAFKSFFKKLEIAKRVYAYDEPITDDVDYVLH